MKCHWKNRCPRPNRCCHFCKKKDCWQRCKDENSDCKYFIDEKDDEIENKENKSNG